MKKRYAIATFALLFLQLNADTDKPEKLFCREEFDISEQWHDGMTWKRFLAIRYNLTRPDLIKYVDKIEVQRMAKEAGLEVPKTYLASREKVPFIDLISDLSTYVAKPIHLSCADGLMIVKNGINIITGKPITPEQVQEQIFKTFERKPRKVECWALHQVEPGFMIQEYVPNREEIKIQTIWGKAVTGEWRGGKRKGRPNTRIWGQFTRSGETIKGSRRVPEWWPEAIAAAELIAKGTDALRVDFLVRENGELLLNEFGLLALTNWSNMREAIEAELNNGYREFTERNK